MKKPMDKLTVRVIWEKLVALWVKSNGNGNTPTEVEGSDFLKAKLREKGYSMEMMCGEKGLYPYRLPIPTPDLDIFTEQFRFALKEMARVYASHKEEQRNAERQIAEGDSWKEMTPIQLRILLTHAFDEYLETPDDSPAEYNKLLDILNAGLMLLTRLAEERKGNHETDKQDH